jgi:thioester reductase-like protein
MDQTKSRTILFAPEIRPLISQLTESRDDIRAFAVEALDSLLSSNPKPMSYEFSFEDAIDHPIVVLHSSGSTGIPKPITMTNGTFAALDNDRNFRKVPGRRTNDWSAWDFDGIIGGHYYSPFPPFHLGGFLTNTMLPLFSRSIPVFGPPVAPPSGKLAAEIMSQVEILGTMLPPSIAEQLLLESENTDYFRRLRFLCFAGGPLSKTAGDRLSKLTTLCQFFGSTETAGIRQLVPLPEDWPYIEFHPLTKVHFEPSGDDAYELILYADESTISSSTLNHNLPGVREYYTKDLLRSHPTKANLWQFHGRKDDIIVLSNGEKLYPIPMELALTGHAQVAGALVTGTGRFQPALLLEPKSEFMESATWRDDIWPIIEEANTKVPGHGRIMRSMVIVARKGKPFLRAGKGTVVRKLTENAYAAEISELYKNHLVNEIALSAPIEKNIDVDELNNYLRSLIVQVAPGVEARPQENLYNHGFDSLKTIETISLLRAALAANYKHIDPAQITANIFYEHPTISDSAKVIKSILNNNTDSTKRTVKDEMDYTYHSLIHGLQTERPQVPKVAQASIQVAITGTTGSLGTLLLLSLLKTDHVSRVFCLNRSPTAYRAWRSRPESKGINDSRARFLTADLEKAGFGLEPVDFTELMSGCDVVIHAAWKVDFNQSLPSFADSLRGVRAIIDLSVRNNSRPHIMFISSLSSTGLLSRDKSEAGEIPESIVADFSEPPPLGYGQSKHIAERVLAFAANEANVPVSILRIGQIAGSTTPGGSPWSNKEFVPGVIRTSRSMSIVPDELLPVDWIPIDKVADIIIELMEHDLNLGNSHRNNQLSVYNIVNPRVMKWSDILKPVVQYAGPEANVVSLHEWCQRLKASDRMSLVEVEEKPSLKTMGFLDFVASSGAFKGCATYKSEQASPTMASLEPISAEMLHRWITQGI